MRGSRTLGLLCRGCRTRNPRSSRRRGRWWRSWGGPSGRSGRRSGRLGTSRLARRNANSRQPWLALGTHCAAGSRWKGCTADAVIAASPATTTLEIVFKHGSTSHFRRSLRLCTVVDRVDASLTVLAPRSTCGALSAAVPLVFDLDKVLGVVSPTHRNFPVSNLSPLAKRLTNSVEQLGRRGTMLLSFSSATWK